jgi:hypothetical protein
MARILIRFDEYQVSEPIASQIIIEYKVPMAILSAHINSKGGEILAEVPDSILENVVNAFRQRGVSVTIAKLIEVDTRYVCRLVVASACEAIVLAEDSIRFDKEVC